MAPKAYESMRDGFIREGMDEDDAKAKAAKIFNARHPDNPVTGKHVRSARKKDKRGKGK